MSENLHKKRIPFVDMAQVTSENMAATAWWCAGVILDGASIDVATSSGPVKAELGDYIVKDKNGHCTVYVYDQMTKSLNPKEG